MSFIDNMASENKNLDNLLDNLNVSTAENPEPVNQGASTSNDEPRASTSNDESLADHVVKTEEKKDSVVKIEDKKDSVLQTRVSNDEEVNRIKSLIEVQVDIIFNLKDSCENVDIQRAADDLQPTFHRTSTELVSFCEFAHIQLDALYREVDNLDVNTQQPERILEISGTLEAYRKQFEQINKALREKFGANQLFWQTFQEIEDYLETTGFWGAEEATSYFVDPLEFLKPETDHEQN